MLIHQVALRARRFANALTLVLAGFGSWGWLADDQMALAPRVALALIALVTQQLANSSGACASLELERGRGGLCSVGAALALLFASVSGVGIEHAIGVVDQQRSAMAVAANAEERARLEASIDQSEHERVVAEAAIRALPINLPTRRIIALQRPLSDAITRAEARIAERRGELSTLSRPPPPSASERAGAQVIGALFWALALGEPGFYFLLACIDDGPVPAVPPVPTKASGLSRASSRNAIFSRLAAVLAGTATFGAAASAEPGSPAPEIMREAPKGAHAGQGRDAAADRDNDLLRQAQALQAEGFSLRRIEKALGVRSKSTFHRMLRAAKSRPS